MKSRYFKQNTGFGAIRPSITRLNRVHSEHGSSSCARTKRCFVYRCSSSIAFGLAARSSVTRLNRASGFTLLEVMVALAIFATAAMTLTKVAMQYTQSTSNAILRTKAQFVALNEVAQMEINQEWMEGTASKQLTQQGETWQIDKRSEPTVSPNVQRIELQVSLVNQDSGQVESGISNLMFFNHRMNNTP
ncbi:type II secretion system minor pseudopilin GspI [Acinetobacter sp. YH01021]|uniref:type II secretion system minor pseudopilin GspI n=1 Tax=Acinetobacter sp. YH01021 TaxID=2601035 RepID=UPI00211E4140|nr:type II secretion system minor pseudopilin GspI [Acinetobacter sp. YH01021]